MIPISSANSRAVTRSRHFSVYERPDGGGDGTDWFRVVEYEDCGLGFVNPRPSDEAMQAYYYDGYYDWLETADHSARYAAEASYLPPVSNFAGRPRLLDIGCGVGTFARYMAERGWAVAGVEPFCPIEIDDFPVHRTYLTGIDGLAESFDAVTAWAVMEHVTDPKAYFKKTAEILKPGGVFVFLVTNFDSLSSKRLFQEDVPRHCHFFTRATIEHYLDEVGMGLESVRFDDTSSPWDRAARPIISTAAPSAAGPMSGATTRYPIPCLSNATISDGASSRRRVSRSGIR